MKITFCNPHNNKFLPVTRKTTESCTETTPANARLCSLFAKASSCSIFSYQNSSHKVRKKKTAAHAMRTAEGFEVVHRAQHRKPGN